tara:strand:+ start:80 stop:448 length:369 start_codon:yes stop_codon:yes gene_type:complete
MKQSKTEKAVFAKLSTQKVELNMIKEIESDSLKVGSIYEGAITSTLAAIKEINSAIQDMERVVKLSQDVLSKGEEVEKLADNIGADLNPSTTNALDQVRIERQIAIQKIKDLNKGKQLIQPR